VIADPVHPGEERCGESGERSAAGKMGMGTGHGGVDCGLKFAAQGVSLALIEFGVNPSGRRPLTPEVGVHGVLKFLKHGRKVRIGGPAAVDECEKYLDAVMLTFAVLVWESGAVVRSTAASKEGWKSKRTARVSSCPPSGRP
jgi:tRNA U34 5-carboxymethylaminomethyl modifying enzyme MnmG/GidA